MGALGPSFLGIEGALACDLIYWREDGERHTLLTLAGPLVAGLDEVERVELTFALFDVEGSFVTTWKGELGRGGVTFVDSREVARANPAAVAEGGLAVYVTVPGRAAKPARALARNQALVDWFSDSGELVSLHSDQSIARPSCPLEMTEIVFRETPASRTFLVIVNGPDEQPAPSLRLCLRNARGEERRVAYDRAMAPFSVHKIVLRELASDLMAFVGDADGSVTGDFGARSVYTRAYVMTDGAVVSGYHGGDRYPAMSSVPRLVHRTFPYRDMGPAIPPDMMLACGQKEMNPAYATHGPALTTRVHLFQSHGKLESDFAVDATLYDREGRVIAHRERWRVAPRRGVVSGDVSELSGGAPFEGHIALRFSDSPMDAFPQRLQALMEYRTGVSVARSMLWSDRWNAPDRLLAQRTWRALYRVFMDGRRASRIAVTNPGVGADYDREAPYVLRLRNAAGDELVHQGTLRPHATVVARIEDVFLGRFTEPLAIVFVESPFDLASMHLTEDTVSGVVSAEHLMAVGEAHVDGGKVWPCGA